MSLEFINNFLERFEKITPPDLFIRKKVQKEIKEKIGIEIDLSKIKYNSKKAEVYLKIDPLIKGEVFIKKEKILESLKKELNKKSPKKIL